MSELNGVYSDKKNRLIQEAEQQRIAFKSAATAFKTHTHTVLSFKFWSRKIFSGEVFADQGKLIVLVPVGMFLIKKVTQRLNIMRLTSLVWGGVLLYKQLKARYVSLIKFKYSVLKFLKYFTSDGLNAK